MMNLFSSSVKLNGMVESFILPFVSVVPSKLLLFVVVDAVDVDDGGGELVDGESLSSMMRTVLSTGVSLSTPPDMAFEQLSFKPLELLHWLTSLNGNSNTLDNDDGCSTFAVDVSLL